MHAGRCATSLFEIFLTSQLSNIHNHLSVCHRSLPWTRGGISRSYFNSEAILNTSKYLWSVCCRQRTGRQAGIADRYVSQRIYLLVGAKWTKREQHSNAVCNLYRLSAVEDEVSPSRSSKAGIVKD